MSNTYRELKAWQRSIDLAEKVYKLTRDFPRAELYGLSAQMRAAAISIPSNIAEGWGRRSRREYGRFVLIARGSNDELQTQLVLAARLKFGDRDLIDETTTLSDEVGRLLAGLYAFLQRPRKQ